MAEGETVHASCVLVGEAGILIRGAAGAGKSTLARALVRAAVASGRFACLVSDDRTRLASRHGRLLAQSIRAIAGRIEVRGAGILPEPCEAAVVVRLIVDLWSEDPPRLPEAEDAVATVCGVTLPRLRQRLDFSTVGLVLDRSGVRDTLVTE
jgi:HPr Serine kinase C-terminal domain